MPGRQSHGAPPSRKSKVKNNSKKRALDAYSIAAHENPDNLKIRQSRLGASEGGSRPGKRRREEEDDEDDGDEEEEQNTKKQRKGLEKGRFDELDVEEGSDSEGNEWKLGQVDSDDDSELDSDEAFGESDEERFEGYTFSGSTQKSKKKTSSRTKNVNLDENDSEEDSDSELEEGDLGEGAVDLADMLDASSEEEEDSPPKKKTKSRKTDSNSLDEIDDPSLWDKSDGNSSADVEDMSDLEDEPSDEGESDDDSSSMSSADFDEASNPAKIAALHQTISGLSQKEQSSRGASKATVHDYDIIPQGNLTLDDFGLAAKSLMAPGLKLDNKKGAGKPLDVPLAKRQQDRLDRSAAYEKSKETLDRWKDTVKNNRRAEHLMFPLPDQDTASAKTNNVLMPIVDSNRNELEATIQSILEESGLAAKDGKDAEDHIREFEELEANKMSIEEVKERRQQLRMARELMFREEVKAKRIKKIKSRSYRRVHRKEREKEDRLTKEALAEGGFEPSEDELEAQDRRRATERMGQKHRGSKWAKSTKETGRAAWDEDARAGITEMARKDEELRKRIEGRAVRRDVGDGSDIPYSESDDDASEEDESSEQKSILKNLISLGGDEDNRMQSGPGSKLANMAFMQKAAATKRKENNALVEQMRREIAGEDTPDEDEDLDIGRRIFGPGSDKYKEKATNSNANEFEEPAGSEDDIEKAAEFQGFSDEPIPADYQLPQKMLKPSSKPIVQAVASEGGAWSKATNKSSSINDAEAKRRRHKKNDAIEVDELDLSKAAIMTTKAATKGKKKPSTKSIDLEVSSSEESGDDNAVQLPFAMRDHELIKRAFAGADVVGEFEAEKRQTIADEDEKIVDETIPGWGSWVGDGLSKKAKAMNKNRRLTKLEGIKEKNRKDAKLSNVIINQKRIKKTTKYLASTLPHPFETRQQYERSLRQPVGPEWSTKETFQDSTKPRILMKQGIITPMSKPLL